MTEEVENGFCGLMSIMGKSYPFGIHMMQLPLVYHFDGKGNGSLFGTGYRSW